MMSVFFILEHYQASKQCLLKDVRKVQVIVRGKKGEKKKLVYFVAEDQNAPKTIQINPKLL